jgi:hypothetical protein
MSSSPYAPVFPSTAYWLSLIGGLLIVLDGFAVIGEAIAYRSVVENIVPGASGILIGLGALAVVVGLIIVFLGLRIKSNPASARTSGILIIVLSLVSFVGGGGFFIGLILALIGGIVAAIWNPPMLPQPMYGRPGPGGSPPWTSPSSPPLQPGGPQRFCSSCGSPNVASAQFCAKCGAPM